MDTPTRRALLGSGTAVLGALAGCAGSDRGSGPGTDTTDTARGTDGTPAAALDLREANVTEVSIDDRGDGEYRFDVTLYHDDAGEDGYANWWQVETLDDEQLGRRELLHAHGTQPFTRSATMSVPGDVDCVVVRGHDRSHGYGGRAMLVTVADGATTAVRQGGGPERAAFDRSDCP